MDNIKAKDFVTKWTGHGNEKQETQQYWNGIIYDVLGAPADTVIQYEKPVKINGQTKFIDAYVPETKTLIEQKSLGIDLMKAELQSDGTKLTPYEQGRRYGGYLSYDEQPRWIIDCNFEQMRVHDMKKPGDPPEVIYLKDLEKDYTRLKFMVNTEDEHLKKEFEVSVQAGEIVGVLYDKLLEQYKEPDEHALQSLNRLCVRIVFCLYAEDAGLFGDNTHAFHDYMAQFRNPSQFRRELKEYFNVLNTPLEKRDKYLDPQLAAFPYVNGGLFEDDNLELPFFTDEIVDIILEKASADFDWSDISPTIFGAIFESTLNPETRRSGGMHYTSIENIHKVIDPLFLDELKEELATIQKDPIDKSRNKKLREYQNKLASLKFLDPACGSGNFLTESYLCLRRLENEIIADLLNGQIMLAFEGATNPIKVSIKQFYGIEINDFACATAQTAMWIAEAKTMKETEVIIKQDVEFFPLTTNANIVEANALRIDWNNIVPASQLNYIMGNPPFVGAKVAEKEQKEDLNLVFSKKMPQVGHLDYVCGWYGKACEYMEDTCIQGAFVSTNSITQGEQVMLLWGYLMKKYPSLEINYSYRTFQWDSEASIKAHVHCVVIGFSLTPMTKRKMIFNGNGDAVVVKNINPYLIDADNNIFIAKRKFPLCNVPEMTYGCMPADGGNLLLSENERNELLAKEPNLSPIVKRYIGAKDFINGKPIRYCLWLSGISPSIYRSSSFVLNRIEAVKEFRKKSSSAGMRKEAATPSLFHTIKELNGRVLCLPEVSSERRRYIPVAFINAEDIPSNTVIIVSNATLYLFAVLISNVHMAWMRTVAGRLEMRYRYSGAVVYNNFPWPDPTPEQKAKIEATAQGILDARAKYPDASLADLYDELTMPIELRKAHQANDRAVMEAYGFSVKMTEQECVAELMKMYQKLIEEVK